METRDQFAFPPPVAAGRRVWTQDGYLNHGPIEGPRVNVAPNQGGTITEVQQPYYTRHDLLLYTVEWDKGQVSKHYERELFCIGRFRNRVEFEAAIRPAGRVELTVGPGGGFRQVQLELEYDGHEQVATLRNERLWRECIEPIVRRAGMPVATTRLKMAARRKVPK